MKEFTVRFNVPTDDTGEPCCLSEIPCPFYGTKRFGTEDVCAYPTDDSFQTTLESDKSGNIIRAKHCPFTKETTCQT
jgi:hypothetical protein